MDKMEDIASDQKLTQQERIDQLNEAMKAFLIKAGKWPPPAKH